jgi:hypothetical protein
MWPTSASMAGRGGRRGLPGQERQRMHGGGPTRRMIENTAAGYPHRDGAHGAAGPGGRGAALPGAAGARYPRERRPCTPRLHHAT